MRVLTASLAFREAEAIALASEAHADGFARRKRWAGLAAPERVGLRVTGVLGLRLRAKRGGQIVSVRRELDALRDRPRFFVSPDLDLRVLKSAGE